MPLMFQYVDRQHVLESGTQRIRCHTTIAETSCVDASGVNAQLHLRGGHRTPSPVVTTVKKTEKETKHTDEKASGPAAAVSKNIFPVACSRLTATRCCSCCDCM
eukprot:284891-Amphidinium_carterae.1